MRNPNTVFIDFDGTLCDTETDIRLAWKATLADMGLPTDRFDAVFKTGPMIDDVVRALYPDRATPEFIDRIRGEFGRHYDASGFPNSRPYPGVVPWLERLASAGVNAVIVTNKRLVATELFMDVLGWRKLVSAIYAADMFPGRRLVKADLLAVALEREGADPARSAMVGDTKGDIDAGKVNGLFTVGVLWGYGSPEELAGADLLVSHPDEIVGLPGEVK